MLRELSHQTSIGTVPMGPEKQETPMAVSATLAGMPGSTKVADIGAKTVKAQALACPG